MANGNGSKLRDRSKELGDRVGNSQVVTSIIRPGSIFRRGYTDSPRNRSYVIMNSVLYHLHPVKVKRHAVKVSYTLCLGGLSFFLFILLTITGIFDMGNKGVNERSTFIALRTAQALSVGGSIIMDS